MGGIVIIGAGECGARAAMALREEGYDGAVTLIGTETGFPYERPPLSKPAGREVERKEIWGAEKAGLAAIDYLPGETAAAIDVNKKRVSLRSGAVLDYDKLLLATGASPRLLACPGGEHARTFRTHADAEALYGAATAGKRVAIIGAGLIGMELAACLCQRGAEITVIETAGRPLGRAVPEALAWRLHERHSAAGVAFVFGASIARLEAGAVGLEDGRSIAADLIIAAIGVVPNVALAKAAGLATGNGVLVDAQLRTSAPDVFAAGDCACIDFGGERPIRFESWRNAQAQGALAARNLLGRAEAFATQPWFWSDQYELGLQAVGLIPDEHVVVQRRLGEGAEIMFFLDAGGRLRAAAGLGPGNAVARDIRLAEMLIDRGLGPEPALLADPATNLKSLLKQPQAA
jgi:3-phenylpropionate/trans-cinnamate dioxygenase ferredoxin reductase subunit